MTSNDSPGASPEAEGGPAGTEGGAAVVEGGPAGTEGGTAAVVGGSPAGTEGGAPKAPAGKATRMFFGACIVVVVAMIVLEAFFMLRPSSPGAGGNSASASPVSMAGSERALIITLLKCGPEGTAMTEEQKAAVGEMLSQYVILTSDLATYQANLVGPKETFFTQPQQDYLLAHRKTARPGDYERVQTALEKTAKVSMTAVDVDALPAHSFGPMFSTMNTNDAVATILAMHEEGPAEVRLTSQQARALLSPVARITRSQRQIQPLVQKMASSLTPAQRALWAFVDTSPPADVPPDCSVVELARQAQQNVRAPLIKQ